MSTTTIHPVLTEDITHHRLFLSEPALMSEISSRALGSHHELICEKRQVLTLASAIPDVPPNCQALAHS